MTTLEQAGIKIDEPSRTAVLEVDLDVHSREAVFGAAYVFLDRCYVRLDKAADGRWIVELKARSDEEASLEDLAGDFGNELLAQSTRAELYGKRSDLVQSIVNRTLVGAGAMSSGAPALDLDELESLDLDEEPFDDPLGIAMSWEQKYGAKDEKASGSGDAKPANGRADDGPEGDENSG